MRYLCARSEDLRDDSSIDRMLNALEAACLAFVIMFALQGERA